MTNFICKVMTPQGQIVKIKVKESDKIKCIKKLKKNGMTPISIEPSILNNIFKSNKKNNLTATIYSKKKKRKILRKSILNSEFLNRVSLNEIKEFTMDFYTLKKSNFNNKHALLTLVNKTENTYFKKILKNIYDGVEQGKFIYKIMKEYKDVFPIVYINLIKTGELTNSLEASLEYAITYLENEEKIKDKVKNVLFPNIVAFCGIILMLILALLIVIPNLQEIFKTYGINLYIPKFIMFFSKIFGNLAKYWYILIFIIGITVIYVVKCIENENRKYKFDKFKYENFICGKLVFLLDFSRIIRSIYLNLRNKMRLEEALEISKQVTQNSCMNYLIEKSINSVYAGKSWFESFEDEKMLNPLILELLKKCSEPKSLYMYDVAIQYIDKEIEKEFEKTLKILPTISYTIVGIVLLILILTIFIPCMQIFLGGFLFI